MMIGRHLPALVALVLLGCTTEERRQEYEHIQEVGLQIVAAVERDSDFAIRAAAILSAGALSDAAAAGNEVLATHPIWPSCLVRGPLPPPFEGLSFNLAGCSSPFDGAPLTGAWAMGFVVEEGELRYGYGVDDMAATATVGDEALLADGEGAITGAEARTMTWTGRAQGADGDSSLLTVLSELDVEVEEATGCRTVSGTASASTDIGVTVTFDGYRACRHGDDESACPSGALRFEAKHGTVDLALDGTATAAAEADFYAADVALACDEP